jgi:CHASE1-domain containing sensor protein
MYEVVNESVDTASLALNEFRTSAALIPDEVKFSPEFMSAKRSYNVAFKILQDFNKNSPKEYQKRRSDEWRSAKISANK